MHLHERAHDRPTYVQPLFDVYRAAPPILKAYLCSLDRIYLDDQLIWNADFRITTDPQTQREYRTIGVRRGLLERKVGYTERTKSPMSWPTTTAP